jgi:iron complex transport system substrate-binding protein
MNRTLLTLLLSLLAAALTAAAEPPRRIVSNNLLTDQWLLALAPRDRVASVTWLSRDPAYSPLWRVALEVPSNRGSAEEVLRFKPDLVLAGRYAATETVRMLERLGVRVVVFDYAPDFEGIAAQAREIGALIGEPEAAERFAASMQARLERVRESRPAHPLKLLEYGQNGWTHGRGTVLDLLLREAGHANVAAEHGVEWMAQLPLEQVVRMQPEGFIIPRRNDGAPSLAHGVFDHAAFRAVAARGLVVTMPPGTTDFGGPATIDALEYLADALREARNRGE